MLFFACPGCASHVKRGETVCPHCGAALRNDGSNARTAAAIALGLTVAAGANCTSAVADYGIACTSSNCFGSGGHTTTTMSETGGGGGASTSGSGGAGGTSGSGGAPGTGGSGGTGASGSTDTGGAGGTGGSN